MWRSVNFPVQFIFKTTIRSNLSCSLLSLLFFVHQSIINLQGKKRLLSNGARLLEWNSSDHQVITISWHDSSSITASGEISWSIVVRLSTFCHEDRTMIHNKRNQPRCSWVWSLKRFYLKFSCVIIFVSHTQTTVMLLLPLLSLNCGWQISFQVNRNL